MSDPRPCPVCNSPSASAEVFLPANLDKGRLTGFSYASRKTPEFMNHGLVRCSNCDLVFVNEPPERDELSSAYHEAEYDSSEEADDAAAAYLSAMTPVIADLPSHERALEIGTGTGVLLELLGSVGFTELVGIEPSTAAIASAPPRRRAWIRAGVFEDQQFEPHSFDLVCCFMTLEHVLDPKVIADAVFTLLRPGGAFVTVTHDYRSGVNRFLGKRSPIIDIEHMQLFSETSIRQLLERSGYERIEVRRFKNRYAIRYWWRLLPLPGVAKRAGVTLLHLTRLEGVKIAVNVGNTVSVGFVPRT